MQLYIVRHGQTEFNIGEPRFRGQHDIPLSKAGVQQAKAIALALKSIPLDSIYFSQLLRAKETAETIRRFHPSADFIEEPHLITLNFGDWQGKFHKDVFKTDKEQRQWFTNPNTFLIPNGETFYDVLGRIHRLLIHLRGQADSLKHVALITHRIVIIHILLYLFKLDPSHFWDFHVNTASITQLEYNPDNTFRLIKLNKTTHLGNLV